MKTDRRIGKQVCGPREDIASVSSACQNRKVLYRHLILTQHPLSLTYPNQHMFRYGGWTDNTYLFVFLTGCEPATVDINICTFEELDGVIYNVHTRTTTNINEIPVRVPEIPTEDVCMYM